jgi:SAM-dependent methyltransferase
MHRFDDELYFTSAAACFVRGYLLDAPIDASDDRVCTLGADRGLDLHKFKRTMGLPRVNRVLGALEQLRPVTLLDVGSGRGAFLWPLLDRFPDLCVTAIDPDPIRARDLRAVAKGGMDRLRALEGDAAAMETGERFDVVTVLEVLEHVDDPVSLARACVGRAGRAVIVSVPSQPDHNPGHVRLFTLDSLRGLLLDAGARRVSVDQVRGHHIAIATV